MQIDRPILIVLIIFTTIALVFFLAIPKFNEFKNLQTELGVRKAEFNAKYSYYSEITKDHFIIQSRQEDIKKIDDALPEDPDFGQLIYWLQKKASESGIVVKNLYLSQGSGDKKQATVNDITLSFDLMGSYSSLANFLQVLERSSRIFEATSISFSSPRQSESSEQGEPGQTQEAFNFSLSIKTHSY